MCLDVSLGTLVRVLANDAYPLAISIYIHKEFHFRCMLSKATFLVQVFWFGLFKWSVSTKAVMKRGKKWVGELHFSVLGKETGLDILGSQEDKSFFSADTRNTDLYFHVAKQQKFLLLCRKFGNTTGAIFSCSSQMHKVSIKPKYRWARMCCLVRDTRFPSGFFREEKLIHAGAIPREDQNQWFKNIKHRQFKNVN